jgi:hypothetical protein
VDYIAEPEELLDPHDYAMVSGERASNLGASREVRDIPTRTLHAVRSIAIFILIMVTSSFISIFLYAIALVRSEYGNDGEGFLVFSGLIALIGLIAALIAAWSEYSKSS